MRVGTCLFLGLLSVNGFSQDWRSDFDELVRAPEARQSDLMRSVLDKHPNWRELWDAIRQIQFPRNEGGKTILRESTGSDGKTRPWVLYVPKSYRSNVETPFLVVLHGSVTRPQIQSDPVGSLTNDPWLKLADRMGAILAAPMGQAGATWWDAVGMANIKSIVRAVKQDYKVDDDRVFMGGFSDGASGAFVHAMLDSEDYAAFVALNGDMSVGSEDGGLDLYATNLYNSPMYVVTTDKDELYPTRHMRPLIEMAQNAFATILYHELQGHHSFDYAETELPQIEMFLSRHPRDPIPSRIFWEASDPKFGAYRWFQIDGVADGKAESWHQEHNAMVVDDSVSVGIQPDSEFKGKGVRIASLAEGETLARSAGLQVGDVIVEANGRKIDSESDLSTFKQTVRRGDSVTLLVDREGSRQSLKGNLPATRSHLAFKRGPTSAMAQAMFSANNFYVDGSRLGAYTIKIDPNLVRLDRQVSVSRNGRWVFQGMVKPSAEVLLRDFLKNRDRKKIVIAEVHIPAERK